MRRALLAIAVVAALAAPAFGQKETPARRVVGGASLPAACTDGASYTDMFRKTGAAPGIYTCTSGSWVLSAGGGTVTSVGSGTIGSLFTVSWATATSTPALSLDITNQGTTTTVLHGNAAGHPAFGAVVPADTTNIANTNTGNTFAGSNTFAQPLTLSSALTVANGGTGAATLGANGVILGQGASAVHVTGAGTVGQVLTSNGAGVDPTFQAAAAGGVSCSGCTANVIPKSLVGGTSLQDSAITESPAGTLTTSAGTAAKLIAGDPVAAASTTAGVATSITASNATAGTTNAGAAAGGSVNITAGAAARNTSGNANGGSIINTLGAKIGSGADGAVDYVFPSGTLRLQSPDVYSLFLNNHTLYSALPGAANTVFGAQAAGQISTGTGNTILGSSAGSQDYSQRVLIGNNAAGSGGGGDQSVDIGSSAAYFAAGTDGVIVGYRSGLANQGDQSGGLAGLSLVAGAQNTWIGSSIESTVTTPANSIALGFATRPTAPNAAFIGDINVTRLQLGSDSNAAAARTYTSAGARAGTDTNVAGSNLNLLGGLGTGTGASGNVAIQTAPSGASGTTQGVAADRLVFAAHQVTLTESSATAVADVGVAVGTVAGGTLWYTIRADDGTDFQVLRGRVLWSAVNKAGVFTTTLGTPEEITSVSSGTLTNTATITSSAGKITLNLNAVSSLTQTTLYAYVRIDNDGTGTVTTK